MNNGLGTHNALLDEAKRRNKRESSRSSSAKIFAVSAFVIFVYLFVAFAQGALA